MLLAGGAARRFGGAPKGLMTLGETRIADRVLAALRGATDRQLVIANDARAPEWFPGVPVAADAVAGLGPLAGIETALRAANGADVLIVAWDMPFVTAPLLRGLRARGDVGASAVLPAHGAGPTYEPLCAFYAARTLETCTALLAAGARRALALFETLPDAFVVPEEIVAQHGVPERLFLSVDSPEALAQVGELSPQEARAVKR